MEIVRYGDFSQTLHHKVVQSRTPISGSIEISHRCPLNCAHCYNNLPMGDIAARRRELALEDYVRIFDELAEMGCLWLLFTGGEIFARRDFLDIYQYAKQKGFLITLFTNGTLISERIADFLVEWPPFSIEITLYGFTRKTYERMTRRPGMYDRCMRGIRLLLERGLPLKLKTVAVSLTVHELEDMTRFAREELGLEFKFDAMINPRIDCSHSPLEVRLTPAEVVQLDLEHPQRVEEWQRFARDFHRRPPPDPARATLYECGGGMNSFAIDPYGRLSICVLSHRDTYDLKQGSFREGWEQFLHRVRARIVTRTTKCTACAIKALCGMCPANGELENGDPEEPVDFLCHVAHLRALAMDIEIPAHGNCEYCPGGERHAALLSSLQVLRRRLRHRVRTSLARSKALPMTAPGPGECSLGGCQQCDLAPQPARDAPRTIPLVYKEERL